MCVSVIVARRVPAQQFASRPVSKVQILRITSNRSIQFRSPMPKSPCSHNLILHGRVGGGGSGGSAGAGIRVLVAARLEVVGHLRVELLGRLLGRASALTTALLVGASLADGAGLARVGVLLAGGGRLGLSLGLRGTLGKGLDGRDNLVGLGSAHNDLDLDRAVVDEQTIELLEGLASAIRLVEGDVGDTAALRVGSIHEVDSLDRSYSLDEVFLWRKVSQ